MQLEFKKSFNKAYKNLPPREKNLVDKAIADFRIDPFSEHLRNHDLKGNLKGQRAFSAAHDLRIVYREEGGHAIVYLLKTGSHNQVY